MVSFKGTANGMDFAASYLTESTREGTKLTSWIEMQPSSLFAGLAEPLIATSLNREVGANLGELKHLLESRIVTAS